jgi:hypothetical protein
MSEYIDKLVAAIESEESEEIESAFDVAMAAKIYDALENRKVSISKSLMSGQSEQDLEQEE